MSVSCLFFHWWFKGRLVKIGENCNSHRSKASISSLESRQLWPMQNLRMEVKFFTSLESRLNIFLFVYKWFLCWDIPNSENRLSHGEKACTIFRRHKLGTNVAAQNETSVLHIIVEKVNKLLICPQMIVMPRYIKKKDKTDYHIVIKHSYDC